MPFGNLTRAMRTALVSIVKGRLVHDLGAGDGDHARTLLKCGADRLVCIDKAEDLGPRRNLDWVFDYIVNVPVPMDLDVVFLGWPVNHHIQGLLPWLEAAKTVIYLGHNFDGTTCGFPALFDHLLQRRLVHHIPDRRNTLLVVEEHLPEKRAPTPEEAAAFSTEVVSCGLN